MRWPRNIWMRCGQSSLARTRKRIRRRKWINLARKWVAISSKESEKLEIFRPLSSLSANCRVLTASSLHHDVHQPAFDHQHLYDLLAFDGCLHFFVSQRYYANLLFAGIGGHDNAATDLAIHLNGDLHLIFFC